MQGSTDAAIRELLLPLVHAEHSAHPETIYIEEFALYGGINRADLAALNGLSHGYEIKSDRDTLTRLPDQVSAYNAVFERSTLVGASRHLTAAERIIPSWWGVIEARTSTFTENICLKRIRDAAPNPAPCGAAIASLLWRPEALRILQSLGLDHGVRSKPMDCLIDRLAEIPAERLARYVREALRARGDWRSASRLQRCDAKPQPPAKCYSIQYNDDLSNDQ